MTPLQAIALGIIQGLSEFLPISSSAHLTLAPWLFGWEDPGLAFDVALHFGTLLAVLWYFRIEWINLVKAAFSILTTFRVETPEKRKVVHLIIATIPGGIGGYSPGGTTYVRPSAAAAFSAMTRCSEAIRLSQPNSRPTSTSSRASSAPVTGRTQVGESARTPQTQSGDRSRT